VRRIGLELRHDVRARMGPTDSGCSSGWRSAGDLLHLQPPSQPITKARTSGGAETLESTQAVASVDRFFERHGDQLLTWPTGSSASSRWPGLLGHRWPRKVSSGPDGKIRSRRGPLTSHRYRGPAPEDLRKMARALEPFAFDYCCVRDRGGSSRRPSAGGWLTWFLQARRCVRVPGNPHPLSDQAGGFERSG
jgi:hypothetical protein